MKFKGHKTVGFIQHSMYRFFCASKCNFVTRKRFFLCHFLALELNDKCSLLTYNEDTKQIKNTAVDLFKEGDEYTCTQGLIRLKQEKEFRV